MIYLSGAVGDDYAALALTDPRLGLMGQPALRYQRFMPSFSVWAADNGCFSTRAVTFDPLAWLNWLERWSVWPNCLFASVPDHVGDAEATRQRFWEWVEPVRSLGYRVAYVAQDGETPEQAPWDAFDALFIGGAPWTTWKTGPEARALCIEGRQRGKWVHMGRVNSLKRIKIAASFGCHSADGTYLKFRARSSGNTPAHLRGPAEIVGWLDELERFEVSAGSF